MTPIVSRKKLQEPTSIPTEVEVEKVQVDIEAKDNK